MVQLARKTFSLGGIDGVIIKNNASRGRDSPKDSQPGNAEKIRESDEQADREFDQAFQEQRWSSHNFKV